MVFCGKPSQGCKHCRTRRIKCDRFAPKCSQCLRAGKQCPGYRDQLSLLFRDETEKVVRKAKVPKSTCSSVLSRKRGTGQTLVAPTSTLTIGSPSVENFLDEGVRFFFSHYVTIVPNPKDSASLLNNKLWPLLFVNQSFKNAVSSVGYAGLSNVTKRPELMVIARSKYTRSLKEVTLLLRNTATADLDATFKAIMLLVAFEIVNAGSHDFGTGSWCVHLDGGVAILKLIAANKPQNAPPGRMQLQFVFANFAKCVIAGESSPPGHREWLHQVKKGLTADDGHAADLLKIVAQFADLHASIRSELLTDHNTIFRELQSLDIALENWEAQLPLSWKHAVRLYAGKSVVVYQGKLHYYRDFWTARVFANFSTARILVNELLIIHIDSGARVNCSRDAAQRTESLAVISTYADKICKSVGCQFDKPTLIQEVQNLGSPALSGCFLLLFPLAVAGSGTGVPLALHNFVIRVLETMGNNMGIAQALAMIAPTRMQREKWNLGRNRRLDYGWLSSFKM